MSKLAKYLTVAAIAYGTFAEFGQIDGVSRVNLVVCALCLGALVLRGERGRE